MSLQSIVEWERKKLQSFSQMQLPNRFKTVGIYLAIISFLALFVNKFTVDQLIYREISKYGMLVGLLLVSISREKIEDELIIKLRMQSFTFAFIAGVGISLIQPFVNFALDSLIEGSEAVFKGNGDFVILWLLLSVQVFCFVLLKRVHKC